MLEQLFSLINNSAQQEIINNPKVPNEQNNQAVGLATESIFSGLQSALANGNLQEVLGLFSGRSNANQSNPLVGNIIEQLTGNLTEKLGISGKYASGIAANIIPMILGSLIKKTNDPGNNQFDMNGILGALLGGDTSHGTPVQLPRQNNREIDFNGILGGMTQDRDGDGDVDLQDILGSVKEAASGMQTQQQQSQGSGIMDVLGQLMK